MLGGRNFYILGLLAVIEFETVFYRAYIKVTSTKRYVFKIVRISDKNI